MGTKITPYVSSDDEAKKNQVERMFDGIAHRYDFLNHFFSLGIDVLWRKTCIRSHSQTTTEVGTIIINGNVQSMVRPVTRQVCDEYASICVPGKDGTHRCPELEDNLD